jgi:hypothetical protein
MASIIEDQLMSLHEIERALESVHARYSCGARYHRRWLEPPAVDRPPWDG